MNSSIVINKILELNYKGFKEAYIRQIEDINYNQLSFDERLYDLLDSEYLYLKNKRVEMNFKLSRIKDKQAVIEEIDYLPQRKLNKSLILSLASMNFLKAKQNIIINGKTGTGKSFLAQAIGNRAIHEGFTVYYIRTSTLLEEIKLSRIDGSYTNLVKRFARYKLLILDDFGISPISVDDATNLFEIIETRNQLSSTIITSQLPVKDWYGYLQNNTVADAILDRVVHSSHRIEIEGDSLRPKYSNLNQKFEEN